MQFLRLLAALFPLTILGAAALPKPIADVAVVGEDVSDASNNILWSSKEREDFVTDGQNNNGWSRREDDVTDGQNNNGWSRREDDVTDGQNNNGWSRREDYVTDGQDNNGWTRRGDA
ncbi:hypothetical protein IEO21_09490 [Rhodonia placenta]|uniref:Uncharacterized protein n=1 Tax=Rhodonia placenta TaxID=104341 RepID=A0A8H7TXV0_9APHY|nr:hypothetical protein IEO21_09490 [Postia placenta]